MNIISADSKKLCLKKRVWSWHSEQIQIIEWVGKIIPKLCAQKFNTLHCTVYNTL